MGMLYMVQALRNDGIITGHCTESSKKNPAKFGDTCSVRADGLCIGCLGQWAERGREN